MDAAEIVGWARELFDQLHACPELSGEEWVTAELVAQALRVQRFDVHTGIGGTGVVAILDRGGGPTVALRSELDALPFGPSDDPQALHACGHDLHLAAVVGAAAVLAADPQWAGRVMVIGQPAEETLEGAQRMIADQIWERCGVPDVLLAQHVLPVSAGMILHPTHAAFAGCRELRLTFSGRPGHAATAQPHSNAIERCAEFIAGLSEVRAAWARRGDAVLATPAVVRGGDVSNVVPDLAEVAISLRWFDVAAADRAVVDLRSLARRSAWQHDDADQFTATDLGWELYIESEVAPVTCAPEVAERVHAAHRAGLSPERVHEFPASMASEDFANLCIAPNGAVIPSAYWFVGCADEHEWDVAPGRTPWEKLSAMGAPHSPDFAVAVEQTLPTAVQAMADGARAVLTSR